MAGIDEKAINATASSMVLANKYKQMKNKVQQTQTNISGMTVTVVLLPCGC